MTKQYLTIYEDGEPIETNMYSNIDEALESAHDWLLISSCDFTCDDRGEKIAKKFLEDQRDDKILNLTQWTEKDDGQYSFATRVEDNDGEKMDLVFVISGEIKE